MNGYLANKNPTNVDTHVYECWVRDKHESPGDSAHLLRAAFQVTTTGVCEQTYISG